MRTRAANLYVVESVADVDSRVDTYGFRALGNC